MVRLYKLTFNKNNCDKIVDVMVATDLKDLSCINDLNDRYHLYNIRANGSKPGYLEHKVYIDRYGYCVSKIDLPEMELNKKNFRYIATIPKKDISKWAWKMQLDTGIEEELNNG